MRNLRILLASLALAVGLSGCIVVERPYHGYHWAPACYGCW